MNKRMYQNEGMQHFNHAVYTDAANSFNSLKHICHCVELRFSLLLLCDFFFSFDCYHETSLFKKMHKIYNYLSKNLKDRFLVEFRFFHSLRTLYGTCTVLYVPILFNVWDSTMEANIVFLQ